MYGVFMCGVYVNACVYVCHASMCVDEYVWMYVYECVYMVCEYVVCSCVYVVCVHVHMQIMKLGQFPIKTY